MAMVPDDERYWLREWGTRASVIGIAPVVVVTVLFVLMVLDSTGWSIVLEVVGFLIAVPALVLWALARNSVTVHTRTGVIERRRFPQSERIDANQRLRVDLRRDAPLTYVFVRSSDGSKTFDVLCDSNVLVWRSRPAGSKRHRRLQPTETIQAPSSR